MLAAMKQQVERLMESLEDKLQNQLHREAVERQHHIARLEDKLKEMEGMKAFQDKKKAEFDGKLKGLSEELQTQIRRQDAVDARLYEFRRQMDDEFTKKHMQFEQQLHQKVSSSSRIVQSTTDEVHKKTDLRIMRHEQEIAATLQDVQERLAAMEDNHEHMVHFHTRLQAIEDSHASEVVDTMVPVAVAPRRGGGDPLGLGEVDSSPLLALFDRRMKDMSEKVERVHQDSLEMQSTCKEHEVELKTLRTLSDTREEHYRWLTDRVERTDWEQKLEQMRLTLQAEMDMKSEQNERLEVLARKVELQEQANEELHSRHKQLLQAQRHGPWAGGLDCTVADAAHQLEVEAAVAAAAASDPGRVLELEQRVDDVLAQIADLRGSNEGSPRRIESLVEELKRIVPTVIELSERHGDHEKLFKQLETEVARMRQDHEHGIHSLKDSIRGDVKQDLLGQVLTRDAAMDELQSRLLQEHKALVDDRLTAAIDGLHGKLREEHATVIGELQGRLAEDHKALVDAKLASVTDGMRGQLRAEHSTVLDELQDRLRTEHKATLDDRLAAVTDDLRAQLREEHTAALTDLQSNLASRQQQSPSHRDNTHHLHRELQQDLQEARQKAIAAEALATETEAKHRQEQEAVQGAITRLEDQLGKTQGELRADLEQQLGQRCSEEASRQLSPVQREVADLRGRLESMGSQATESGPQSAAQEERNEREKLARVYERIDDLCECIQAVDNALANSPFKARMTDGSTAGEGEDAGDAGRHEELAARHEELVAMYEKLAARFEKADQRNEDLHAELRRTFERMGEVETMLSNSTVTAAGGAQRSHQAEPSAAAGAARRSDHWGALAAQGGADDADSDDDNNTV